MDIRIDLHMHSTVSDGTDTPEELLKLVRNAGIELFALTDHDSVKGCGILRKILGTGDPCLLSGVEFSCRDEEGKYHILGYGFDPESPPVRKLLEKGNTIRIGKMEERLKCLRTSFGISFPEEEVRRLFALDNPGKPHLANLMVKYGYAESRGQAFSEILNRIHVPAAFVCPEEAIEGILQGGGIPVLAHPVYGSGEELIIGAELEHRVRRLKSFGLLGLEGFYSGYSPKQEQEILFLAEKYEMYVTAGSDYHGKNKLVRLGDTTFNQTQAIPEGMKRFLRDVHRIQ